MDLVKLRKLARAQFGVFSRAQAAECGASAAQIRYRLTTGAWQRVVGKVLAPAELAITPRVLDRAASLAVPGGVLAGPSAARAWGVPVPDRRVYLAVGPDRHPRVVGLRYLRYDVPARDVTRWQGALITTKRRTILDCLRLLPEGAALDLLDWALNSHYLTLRLVSDHALTEVARPGSRQLRRLIHARSGGSRSEAERRAAALLVAAGLTGWVANAELHDDRGLIGLGDIVFAAARLVIELDGWAFHSSSGQFQRDRDRQNRLIAAGWTVLRFTWLDLTERPEHVIATILNLLAR